jgi:hypothetical protein
MFSKRDDLVYSIFGGAAQDAFAAMTTNRRWLGTEPDKEVHTESFKRLLRWLQFQQQHCGMTNVCDFQFSLPQLEEKAYGALAFLPMGGSNVKLGALDDHLFSAGLQVKNSEKKGIDGNAIGRGLFTSINTIINKNTTITYIWGKIITREMADERNSDKLIALRGNNENWKNCFMVADEQCPGTYVNSFQGTGCVKNAVIVQGSSDGLNKWELIEIKSLVDIPADTEILVDYGADFFPKEMPAAVGEVIL